MSKGLKTTIVILAAMVALGLITLPGLRQAVQRLRSTPKTEEQARREVMQEPISTPTDVQVQAQMYLAVGGFADFAGGHGHSASAFRRSRRALQAASECADRAGARSGEADAARGSKPAGFLHSAGRDGHRGFFGRNFFRNAVGNSQRAVGGAIDRADAWRERERDQAIENSRSRAGSGDARGASGSLRTLPGSLARASGCSCVRSSSRGLPQKLLSQRAQRKLNLRVWPRLLRRRQENKPRISPDFLRHLSVRSMLIGEVFSSTDFSLWGSLTTGARVSHLNRQPIRPHRLKPVSYLRNASRNSYRRAGRACSCSASRWRRRSCRRAPGW